SLQRTHGRQLIACKVGVAWLVRGGGNDKSAQVYLFCGGQFSHHWVCHRLLSQDALSVHAIPRSFWCLLLSRQRMKNSKGKSGFLLRSCRFGDWPRYVWRTDFSIFVDATPMGFTLRRRQCSLDRCVSSLPRSICWNERVV